MWRYIIFMSLFQTYVFLGSSLFFKVWKLALLCLLWQIKKTEVSSDSAKVGIERKVWGILKTKYWKVFKNIYCCCFFDSFFLQNSFKNQWQHRHMKTNGKWLTNRQIWGPHVTKFDVKWYTTQYTIKKSKGEKVVEGTGCFNWKLLKVNGCCTEAAHFRPYVCKAKLRLGGGSIFAKL